MRPENHVEWLERKARLVDAKRAAANARPAPVDNVDQVERAFDRGQRAGFSGRYCNCYEYGSAAYNAYEAGYFESGGLFN